MSCVKHILHVSLVTGRGPGKSKLEPSGGLQLLTRLAGCQGLATALADTGMLSSS